MKFQFASLLLFLLAVIVSTSASPINERDIESPLVQLAERGRSFPVKPDDTLVVDIMAAVKAQLKVDVFAQITATFCEKLKASLDIKAKILGGIISIGDLKIKAIQSAVIKKLKVRLDADIEADVKADVYVPLEADLRKLLGSSPLTETELLKILVDIEVKAKALVKVALPKINVDLKAKIDEELSVAIKKAEVNIPLIADVQISADIDESATLDACINVAAKACLAINVDAEAKVILKGL
ncbi:hypothetical protein G6F56_002383 [Rhizopus delemar]|uniref:Lipid-binding serum glycoprotein N-terminal domain-containing protein n=1 Tax=Rhizopus stolonifer TaxID=4846 RepID=A0A367J0A3_RHIST|nr:hypothetical protein G6F56_002383 [Rhizopus delemar]RCH83364.1 hypothetical protein CU098_005756 [Rhizopus stolonifer]